MTPGALEDPQNDPQNDPGRFPGALEAPLRALGRRCRTSRERAGSVSECFKDAAERTKKLEKLPRNCRGIVLHQTLLFIAFQTLLAAAQEYSLTLALFIQNWVQNGSVDILGSHKLTRKVQSMYLNMKKYPRGRTRDI